MLPKLEETYEQLRSAAAGADLLVAHPITYAAPIVAERAALPWVSTVLAPLLFFSAYDAPVFPTEPRARARAEARALRGARDDRSRAGRDEALGRARASPAREARFAARRASDVRGACSRRTSRSRSSLRCSGARSRTGRRTSRRPGFVFYNGPDALDPKLEAFLAAGAPPVVFTLGTSAVGAAGRFYHESADAAARLGERAVLLTGGFAQNVPDGPLPSDVLLVDRAPHQLLFPRACAVVHQGGVGTTGQALRSGHPMIVVPHGHDQPDNAYRVKKLGVSRTIYPQRYEAAHVARELEQLLRDDYRERAAATAAAVRQDGGADAAVAALEKLLG